MPELREQLREAAVDNDSSVVLIFLRVNDKWLVRRAVGENLEVFVQVLRMADGDALVDVVEPVGDGAVDVEFALHCLLVALDYLPAVVGPDHIHPLEQLVQQKIDVAVVGVIVSPEHQAFLAGDELLHRLHELLHLPLETGVGYDPGDVVPLQLLRKLVLLVHDVELVADAQELIGDSL